MPFEAKNFDADVAIDSIFPRVPPQPVGFFNTSCQGVRVDLMASDERYCGPTVDIYIARQNVSRADAEQLAGFFTTLAARLRAEGAI